MSTPIRIDPGLPPLLWSKVQQAFDNINQNFTTVYASIEGGGITPVDFGNLLTNVSPGTNATYDLGNSLKKWRDLHISGDLNIGSATITSVGSAVNLPSGSTIGGSLLDQEYFRNIEVSGQPTLIADAGGNATLTINPGTGVSITTNATTDTINFTNTGIISASAGTGISVSGTNPLQITNSGIISASAGAGISVSGTNPLQITNTGVTRIEAGNGMIVDVNTGTVTITNGSPASTLRCFEYINLGTGGIVRADNNFDTVNITGDEHILINKVGSAATNNIEFTFNNRVDIIGSVFGEDSSVLVDATDGKHYGYFQGDITGSVFADDSTKLIDAVEGLIVGDIDSPRIRTSATEIALGVQAGETNQGASAIAIGTFSGVTNQAAGSVAMGFSAAGQNQGSGSIAIGYTAGNISQAAGGIAIGYGAGYDSQGGSAVALGFSAGGQNQGLAAVAIGFSAGADGQGAGAVAIGSSAGTINQPANSIIINAGTSPLNGSSSGLYIDPIRNVSGTSLLVYNSTTKEITHSNEINSETSIKININLTDSTIQTWEFTEGGDLIFPSGSSISSENGGSPALVIDGAGNYVDIRDSGTILIGYNSTGSVQIGNPEGGTLTEILSERVKFFEQAVPASSIGVTGDSPGLVAFDATYMYYCTGTYDGVANIWKRVAWSGDTW